jgi:hypothetical protein
MSRKSETLARKIATLIRDYDATPVEKHKALNHIKELNPYELVAMNTTIQLSSR